jgi:hypothetical protein
LILGKIIDERLLIGEVKAGLRKTAQFKEKFQLGRGLLLESVI